MIKSRLLKTGLFYIVIIIGIYLLFVFSAKTSYLNLGSGFSFQAISDGDKQGNSTSYLKIGKDGIEHSYELGNKLEFPYCAMQIHPKDRSLFSTSKKTISFNVTADTALRLPVRLHLFVDGYTKKEIDESFLFLEKMVIVKKGVNHITISPREMETPSWWFTLNKLSEKNLPS